MSHNHPPLHHRHRALQIVAFPQAMQQQHPHPPPNTANLSTYHARRVLCDSFRNAHSNSRNVIARIGSGNPATTTFARGVPVVTGRRGDQEPVSSLVVAGHACAARCSVDTVIHGLLEEEQMPYHSPPNPDATRSCTPSTVPVFANDAPDHG